MDGILPYSPNYTVVFAFLSITLSLRHLLTWYFAAPILAEIKHSLVARLVASFAPVPRTPFAPTQCLWCLSPRIYSPEPRLELYYCRECHGLFDART